ncbi:MAG: zf-HC2 domain-containing protein, partial [Armatimonadetes bacterium]|nr:zf-HC2 domain-containing protein [Anaerolineae bacterium]
MNNTMTPNPDPTICDQVLALIPAYALGVTDVEDTHFVERHLYDCPEAVAELALYTDIQEAMLFDVPLVAAPPGLATRIAEIPAAKTTAAQAPLALRSVPTPILSAPTPQRWGMWAAAAAAILLLIASNVYWLARTNAIQADLTTQVALQNQAIAALTAEDATLTPLVSADSGAGRGIVGWHGAGAVMQVRDLAPTTAAQS